MRKIGLILLVFLALPMLFTPLINTATAVNDISFSFTAHVTIFNDPYDLFGGAIAEGDLVTGVITYDLDTPADILVPYSAIYRYDSPPNGIVAIINGLTFQTNFTDVNFLVNVVNDDPDAGGVPLFDGTNFRSYNNIFPIMLDDLYETPLPPGNTDYHISWQLHDYSGTAISTLDLPTSFNLALWEQLYGLEFTAFSSRESPEYPHGVYYSIRSVVDTISEVPPNWLEDALDEIEDLWNYVRALHEEGEIDDYKYNRIRSSLGLTYNLTYNAMWSLDNERPGFNDLKEGMYNLYYAVRELEGLVKDIKNWVKWGLMPSELAEGIVEELEKIQMMLVTKAGEEAESERMLAVAAVEDAEARGRSLPWLWNQISYIDQYLADAEYWVGEGWLSKAVSYYKIAFYYSQRIVVSAWHWSWDIQPEDWIDQLEANL